MPLPSRLSLGFLRISRFLKLLLSSQFTSYPSPTPHITAPPPLAFIFLRAQFHIFHFIFLCHALYLIFPHFYLYEITCKFLFFCPRSLFGAPSACLLIISIVVLQTLFVQGWIHCPFQPCLCQCCCFSKWHQYHPVAQARILHILLFVISHSWCLITSCWFYLLHFSSLSRSSILLPSSQCCPPHRDCRFQIASCLLSNPWNSFSTYCLCVFWECISAHVVPCLKPINVFPWPHNTVWTLSHSLYSSFPSGSFVSPIIFLFLFQQCWTFISSRVPHSLLPFGSLSLLLFISLCLK